MERDPLRFVRRKAAWHHVAAITVGLLALPLLLAGTAAVAQTTPVISFNANWSISESAPLVVGGQAQIAYDASRLPQCRTTAPDGTPTWSITGYHRLGGVVGSFNVPLEGPAPVIDLPASGLLLVVRNVGTRDRRLLGGRLVAVSAGLIT